MSWEHEYHGAGREEYTGQCMGGPDDGNLVTSTTNEWICVATFFRALDGGKSPHAQVVKGSYGWDSRTKTWQWKFAKEQT